MLEEVSIEKLVFGGQGLGTLSDGRKVFVWNTLPGETVRARIIKKKKSYVEAIAEEVLKPSPERVEPEEVNYLATSPWQMMTYEAENEHKKSIVAELYAREKVPIPAFAFKAPTQAWNYRNKMEYSFWGDDDGLHLSLHMRGSHGKQIVHGSKLALPAIDAAANQICAQLNNLGMRAGDLKTIVVRCSQAGEAAVSLFTKLEAFPELRRSEEVKGIRVYHSNPKSPASVPTRLLYEFGDPLLQDELLGKPFVYDVDSFFQVNIPIFEEALTSIKKHINELEVTDMYAGVGSIGLSLAADKVTLVELDPATVRMASHNASVVSEQMVVSVIETSTEKALDYITGAEPVIFDPPRAGLHPDVVKQVLDVKPAKVVYLSCNPSTQARDLARLQEAYGITFFEAYNFFPRTPHIETLAVLARKD
ncbi:MAG TPA: TRAM domain-containing protein [Candidatus Saccharimonadales bacterium]|nr:TRAM domain-containing protein [Candidatus Saccharimonadales bacterium]